MPEIVTPTISDSALTIKQVNEHINSPKFTIHKQDCFTYKKLQDPKNSFRLLKILPGTSGSTLRCTVNDYMLSDVPKYRATSYEWGRPGPAELIQVDGSNFKIQKNLWDFLQQLQDNDISKDELMFVDAICINQDDVGERNAQVESMGRIYSKAAGLFVWIGQHADNSKVVLGLCSHARNPGLRINTVERKYLETYGNIQIYPFWSSICAITNRSFWSRLWIVQKLLLGGVKNATIFCGDVATPLRIYKDFYSILVHRFEFRDFPNEEMAESYFQGRMRLTLENDLGQFFRRLGAGSASGQFMSKAEIPQPLESLIEHYSSFDCADEKDRIYALLGISNTRFDGKNLDVNYAQSKEDLFLEVLRFCQSNRLILFCHHLWIALIAGQRSERSEIWAEEVQNILEQSDNIPIKTRLKFGHTIYGRAKFVIKGSADKEEVHDSKKSLFAFTIRSKGWKYYNCCLTYDELRSGDVVCRLQGSDCLFVFRERDHDIDKDAQGEGEAEVQMDEDGSYQDTLWAASEVPPFTINSLADIVGLGVIPRVGPSKKYLDALEIRKSHEPHLRLSEATLDTTKQFLDTANRLRGEFEKEDRSSMVCLDDERVAITPVELSILISLRHWKMFKVVHKASPAPS